MLEQIVGIVGALFLLAMIVFLFVGVRQCTDQIDTNLANLPTFHVSYGNAWSGIAYDFETYMVEGNRYIFYGKNGEYVILKR
jgi:hypothetical protein